MCILFTLSLSWCLVSSFQASSSYYRGAKSDRASPQRYWALLASWGLREKSRPHLQVSLGCIPQGNAFPLTKLEAEICCVRTRVPLLNGITLAVFSGWLTVLFRWGSTELLSQLHSLNSVSLKCSWYFGNVQYIYSAFKKRKCQSSKLISKFNQNRIKWLSHVRVAILTTRALDRNSKVWRLDPLSY